MAKGDYRQRAAETKRTRSGDAILKAATKLFGERGWSGTTLADVAEEAGVSVATLHNHYRTKQHLLLTVYFPDAMTVRERCQRERARGTSTQAVVEYSLNTFAEYASHNRSLTAAVIAVFYDQSWTSDREQRQGMGLPVLLTFLADLIDDGREEEQIKPGPDALDLVTYHVMGLMAVATLRSDITTEEVQQLALSQFLSAVITPEIGPSKS